MINPSAPALTRWGGSFSTEAMAVPTSRGNRESTSKQITVWP